MEEEGRNRAAKRLLQAVLADPASRPFKVLPDPWLYPHYYAAISRPVCCADILRTAHEQRRYTLDDVQRDLRRLITNAKKFNAPDSAVYADALTLERLVRRVVKEIEREGEGDDDEDAVYFRTNADRSWYERMEVESAQTLMQKLATRRATLASSRQAHDPERIAAEEAFNDFVDDEDLFRRGPEAWPVFHARLLGRLPASGGATAPAHAAAGVRGLESPRRGAASSSSSSSSAAAAAAAAAATAASPASVRRPPTRSLGGEGLVAPREPPRALTASVGHPRGSTGYTGRYLTSKEEYEAAVQAGAVSDEEDSAAASASLASGALAPVYLRLVVGGETKPAKRALVSPTLVSAKDAQHRKHCRLCAPSLLEGVAFGRKAHGSAGDYRSAPAGRRRGRSESSSDSEAESSKRGRAATSSTGQRGGRGGGAAAAVAASVSSAVASRKGGRGRAPSSDSSSSEDGRCEAAHSLASVAPVPAVLMCPQFRELPVEVLQGKRPRGAYALPPPPPPPAAASASSSAPHKPAASAAAAPIATPPMSPRLKSLMRVAKALDLSIAKDKGGANPILGKRRRSESLEEDDGAAAVALPPPVKLARVATAAAAESSSSEEEGEGAGYSGKASAPQRVPGKGAAAAAAAAARPGLTVKTGSHPKRAPGASPSVPASPVPELDTLGYDAAVSRAFWDAYSNKKPSINAHPDSAPSLARAAAAAAKARRVYAAMIDTSPGSNSSATYGACVTIIVGQCLAGPLNPPLPANSAYLPWSMPSSSLDGSGLSGGSVTFASSSSSSGGSVGVGSSFTSASAAAAAAASSTFISTWRPPPAVALPGVPVFTDDKWRFEKWLIRKRLHYGETHSAECPEVCPIVPEFITCPPATFAGLLLYELLAAATGGDEPPLTKPLRPGAQGVALCAFRAGTSPGHASISYAKGLGVPVHLPPMPDDSHLDLLAAPSAAAASGSGCGVHGAGPKRTGARARPEDGATSAHAAGATAVALALLQGDPVPTGALARMVAGAAVGGSGSPSSLTASSSSAALPPSAFTLDLGSLLDVKDDTGAWWLAQVVDEKPAEAEEVKSLGVSLGEPLICVHYQGWGEEFDEWLPAPPQELVEAYRSLPSSRSAALKARLAALRVAPPLTHSGFSVANSCVVCENRRAGDLLLCDVASCGKGYHLQCLKPPLAKVPTGKWHCPAHKK